jgi:hypothetical protein
VNYSRLAAFYQCIERSTMGNRLPLLEAPLPEAGFDLIVTLFFDNFGRSEPRVSSDPKRYRFGYE